MSDNTKDLELLCKKYYKLKREMLRILWEISPQHDPQLAELPKITEEKNYALKEELGRGRCGTVFKAFKYGKSMAAKVIDKNNAPSYLKLTNLCNEITILRYLSSNTDGVIKLYDVISHPEELIIFTENGDCDLFELQNSSPLKKYSRNKFFTEAASTVKFLSKMGVIHRDIKPENIVCFHTHDIKNDNIKDTKQYFKLIDFGLATRFVNLPEIDHTEKKLTHMCGSPGFFAPEMLSSLGYDAKIDIWSLGAVFLEILLTPDTFSKIWMPNYHPSQINKYHVLKSNIKKTLDTVLHTIKQNKKLDNDHIVLTENALKIEPEERKLMN